MLVRAYAAGAFNEFIFNRSTLEAAKEGMEYVEVPLQRSSRIDGFRTVALVPVRTDGGASEPDYIVLKRVGRGILKNPFTAPIRLK